MDEQLGLLRMLAERLERLNVDSKWARRASGTRGSVIKVISLSDAGKPQNPEIIEDLIQKSIKILTSAGREIPDNNQQ